MKTHTTSLIRQAFKFCFCLVSFIFMAGQASPQSLKEANGNAHLIQWTPLRILPETHQLKLFYEFQPAGNKLSYGIAPSVRIGSGNSSTNGKEWGVELQPFVEYTVKRRPKSEFYCQFFLKAGYLNNYDVNFSTPEYYHPGSSGYFFFFYWDDPGGTYSDNMLVAESFFTVGGGGLFGFRKFFGRHWFMDINAGLQYLAHGKWDYPEQMNPDAPPFTMSGGISSLGDPGSIITSHLGFGYRFIKK